MTYSTKPSIWATFQLCKVHHVERAVLTAEVGYLCNDSLGAQGISCTTCILAVYCTLHICAARAVKTTLSY